MNIQSTQLRTNVPVARQSHQESSTFSEEKENPVTELFQDLPYRALSDVFSVGVAVPAALGASLSSGSAIPTLAAGGAIVHGASALWRFATALDHNQFDRSEEASKAMLIASGDALASLGLGLASAGFGPLSLGFVAAGTITATLAPYRRLPNA